MKATYDLIYNASVGEFVLYVLIVAVLIRLLKEIIFSK